MTARIERVTGAVNTWIIGDDEEVIVVDPGEDAAAVSEAVGERDILAVICTHGHAAHIAAALEVAEEDETPVALHPADRLAWREAHAGTAPEIDMEDGGVFEVADVTLEVLHAPGHTPGSVCLYSDDLKALFAGDVIGGDGPVPHEGEFRDFAGQLNVIGSVVLTLDGETRILPGHGEELTVAAAERKFNAWVAAGPDGLRAGA